MAVKIVTDSLSDITSDLAKKLGVSVVPLYVRFGEQVYKDRIDMTTEEFYKRLVEDPVLPTTTQPTPADFGAVYDKLAKETDEILVMTLSSKLSGTYQSALQAKNMFTGKARIEVIDSQAVIMGLGLLVVAASNAAKAGASLDEVAAQVRDGVKRTYSVMSFDTLKYLARGGRIGKAQSFLGSMLSVKPVLWLKDGEVHPLTRVRSRAAGMDYLYNFVAGFKKIEGLAVEHATTPADAETLIDRLGAIYPKEKIYRATVSPVFGTYGGPHVLSVCVLEGKKD
ncbi:MAG: DegV family protein [Dehalococcoidales bacterium]|nr:DegV family protein [Dehalococcoidales bacterium]